MASNTLGVYFKCSRKHLKPAKNVNLHAGTGLYSPVQSLLALIRPEPGTLVKIITITFKIILNKTGRLLSLFMSEK